MKPGAELDRIAEAAATRYGMLLGSFEAALSRSLMTRDWRSTRARDGLRRAAYDLASAWLDQERNLIFDALDEAGEGAVHAVDEETGAPIEAPSSAIMAHLAALAQELELSLRLQVERDTATLIGVLRDAALRSVLREQGVPLRGARALGALRDDALSGVVFAFPDRAGRRWLSTKHVRTLWRRSLVLAGAEAALIRMSEIGYTQAMVIHPDRSHGNRGRVIALVDGAEGDPWHVVRDEVFQPNTYARLIPLMEDA